MLGERIHRYIYLFGLCALAFGMMVGTVPTSVPQIILAANWLIEMDFSRKWSQLKNNRVFWILSAVFLAHLCGLLYTSDMEAGGNDVRTKMPLMFLPLVLFSSRPLLQKEYWLILYCFLAGCVANTAWCLLYSFVIHQNEVIRNASRFMSHIRLGLYLNVAIATCAYFVVKAKSSMRRFWFLLLAVYFLCAMYFLGLFSGLANFVILFFLGLCVVILKLGPVIKITSFVILFCFLAIVVNYFAGMKRDQLDVKNTPNNYLQRWSPWGTPYIHFDTAGQKENGNYVLINIELDELQREWKRAFPEDSFNYNARHNLQRYEVLVRYLASKGVNKDSAGVAGLSARDKESIRKGFSNYKYADWGFFDRRTYELVNEYDEFLNNRHVNGHSLTMRLYFWKAGLHVLKDHPVTGVGTGDVQQAMNKAYKETNSPLDEEWYKRPHNQFLTITIALGILGLVIFLLSLIYPTVVLHRYLPKLYWPFLIVAVISFLLEDTLETQAGLSFFAFFNSLLLSVGFFRKKDEHHSPLKN